MKDMIIIALLGLVLLATYVQFTELRSIKKAILVESFRQSDEESDEEFDGSDAEADDETY